MKKDILTPVAGESVTEAEVLAFLVPEGTFAKEGAILLELETEKATAEVYAPVSGIVHYIVKEGDVVTPGSKLGYVDTEESVSSKDLSAEDTSSHVKGSAEQPGLSISVAAEKVEEHPAALPKAEQPGVRIFADEAIKNNNSPVWSEPLVETRETSIPSRSEGARGRKEKMSKLRKTIALRLVEAKNTTAMLTTFNEVDMSAVMAIRKKEKETFEKQFGVRLGLMSFFIKAVSLALKAYPAVNAFIEGEDIIYHDYVNMGVAVGTERGLVVPVIPDAQDKTFAEIEQSIVDLAAKARIGKLKMSDMANGTFTISNGGTYGSLLSTPILNLPQSGILGMHAIQDRPVVIDGKIEIRPMMYLALSYDHRVVDGEGSIKFLVMVKDYLENPEKFFIME